MTWTKKTLAKLDSWYNTYTGFGVPGVDKTAQSMFVRSLSNLNLDMWTNLYIENDIAATIVDVVPDECFRQGYEIKVSQESDVLEDQVKSKLVQLDCDAQLSDAMRWARLYGGAGVYVGLDDGQEDQTQPVDHNKVEGVNFLEAVDMRYLYPMRYYRDGANAGKPMVYGITNGARSLEVHETRILKFLGDRVDRRTQIEYQFWGQSVLLRCWPQIRSFDSNWKSLEFLLTEASHTVYKVKGLIGLLAESAQSTLTDRLRMINLGRSIARSSVLDAEDESVEKQGSDIRGVPESLDKTMLRLSAAARIPVTILMGQSPAGMNATGESDFRWFYDRIKGFQDRDIEPKLQQILKWAFPGTPIEIKFNPLWQMTPQEQADLENKQAQTDTLLIQNEVFTPQEIALSRYDEQGNFRAGMSEVRRALREQALKELTTADVSGLGGAPGLPALGAPAPAPTLGGTLGMLGGTPGEVTADDDKIDPATDARAIAREMTDLGVEQCRHGFKNSCPKCGIVRVDMPAKDDDGKPILDVDGKPAWVLTWKAQGDQLYLQPEEPEETEG